MTGQDSSDESSDQPSGERVRLFGIRHHGPGSARSLLGAFDEWQPTAVLVELPADCAPALVWVGHPDLHPPVALLGWVADRPGDAAFLPFADFSPEWCALRWGRDHDVELRAIDLPLSVTLARPEHANADDSDGTDDDASRLDAPVHDARPSDPLAALAAAAGDPDPERWWEDVVEHRGDGANPFAAVAEAMAVVRADALRPSSDEARREAYMRQAIRRATSDGFERIAVVCGAWHVPALAAPLGPAAADARLLRGLAKAKVGVSWVPWTYRRLSSAAHWSTGDTPNTGDTPSTGDTDVPGYGAGVSSPAWYAHVFAHPGPEGLERWFVHAARLLRRHDLPVSPDDLIAASRVAVALGTLRGRPRPGLPEALDAVDAVLAGIAGSGGTGRSSPMALIRDQLVVGDAIGTVPDDAPQVPLARDLAAQQRRARLTPESGVRALELDVRTPSGRNRSVLLHRLRALRVPWGTMIDSRGSSGTFRETWRLRWEPELTIRVIELAGYGTTVRAAAIHRLGERADSAGSLADLVAALSIGLLADLPEAVAPVVDRIAHQAAHDPDLAQVIDTLQPLATALRYGDVRSTDASALRAVFDGLVVRVLAGIHGASRSLDDDAAAVMVERLAATQAALALCDHPARAGTWPSVLAEVVRAADVNGLVRGRATRLLHDSGSWDGVQVERQLAQALSIGVAPAIGAAFVEGFLAGSGTVLVHDAELLTVIDGWVSTLRGDLFEAAMPLLRRTFGGFEAAERRQLGELLAAGGSAQPDPVDDSLDPQRAEAAMRTVRQLLGVPT